MATLSVPPSEREQTLRPTAFSGVFFWGALGLLLVGLLAYVLIVWGGADHFTDADAVRVQQRQKILQDRVTEDYKYLHDKPGYFKKDAGLVRVPIDEAMRMTLADLQKIKPHAAYPIAQSPPQNSSAPSSPDKGAGQDLKTPGKTNDNAPTASNPTVGQASPAPVAPSPAAANNANNPGNPPAPGVQPQPSAPPAETNTSGTAVLATPVTPPAAAPGAQAAPPTNPPVPAATVSPATAALTTAPVANSTPTPNPQTPGASPAGTP